MHNGESETDPIVVSIGCSMKLSKLGEQIWEVIFVDAGACVPHLTNQQALDRVIVHSQVNAALDGEFQGVFVQIDQNLLESSLIADQKRQSAGIKNLHLFVELLIVVQRAQIV